MIVDLRDNDLCEVQAYTCRLPQVTRRWENAMASDPRFDTYSNQSDSASDRYDETGPRRSKWTSCLIGCLAVVGVLLLMAVIAGFWISQHWRGWAADFGSQAINQ